MAPKRKKRLIRTKVFFYRALATFFASALSVIGLGSIFGLDLLKSCLFAGVLGLVNVAESLARAYLIDGKLTMTEINYAFQHYDEDSEEENGYGCHCVNCCPNVE
jgi:hypothetical protein